MRSEANKINEVTIGKINYTNAWPVFYHFNPNMIDTKIRIVTEVPAILNRGMLDGSIQIGALSSFAYGAGSDRLILLPNLSVSSDGEVKSILLFSKKPIESAVNGVISLTNTSATSVNLLKIIIEKIYGGHPTYHVSEPHLESMLANSDAALLIGDNAIRASWEDKGYVVTDLGEVWKKWTGLGMTFAVWAVNKQFALANPEVVGAIAKLFELSKKQSLDNLEPIVEQACREIGGDSTYWRQYFNNLCYDFSSKQQKGLALYYRYAFELGLLPHKVTMELWNDNMVTQVTE
ncbi:menaquinone biosynthesis protein [Paenibacillus sediminis]|uniref:Chorismate dehydratase n=1 Tax=Paenibacillus sediminis TaxID=664909 RepID=A0ABS4GZQ1_9BACL|nr:menaquinone biosynthesis protein [Paenibacillus sediminis]MBP1935760.1 chorismate dehydratase [Paenibacillus sediminis]